MAVSIGPVIGIKGEKEFRATLKEIIAETKKYSAEMDRLTASFDKNDSAVSKSAKRHELLRTQIEKQNKVIEQNAKMLDEAQKKYQRDQESLEKQRKVVEELSKKYAETAKNVETLTKKYGENDPITQKATQALSKQREELQKAKSDLEGMEVGIHRSGQTVEEWETKLIQSKTDLLNLNEEFKNTAPLKAWGEMFQDVGGKMEEFGENLSKYVSAPLAALTTASVKAAADFEDGMAKIYTIAVDSTEPMEKMREELMQLSNETGFSLDDLSEATYQAVSASVDAGKAVDFMADATKLARAGFTTTTKSVDLLTTVINAYNYKAEDAAWISDMLLKTQNDGKTILDELASSMGIIIPMASNYGVGLDQISAAYATMTKQGVKTERATTFLRAVFTELEKEGSDVADILEAKTKKSFAQLMKEGNSLSDVLRILYNSVDGDTEAFQRLFGNVRATQAVASLVNDDFKLFDYELGRVRDSAGQTDKALEQMETPALKAKRAMNQLKNSSVELGESIIQKFTPQFEKGIDIIKKMTDRFNNLSEGSMDVIINAGKLLIVVPPLLTIGGKVLKYVGMLMAGTAPLVPLISAITVGFVGLSTAMQVQHEEQVAAIRAEWGLSEAQKADIASLGELKTKREELQETLNQEWTATLANASVAETLALKYDSLVTSTGEVKEGSEHLAETLLTQIAQSLGMTTDEVKALIDEHGHLHESIMQTIEDYKTEAKVAAYKRELEEATYRQIEAERINAEMTAQLATQADKLTTANQKVKDARQAITDADSKGIPITQEMKDELANASAEALVAERAYREMVDAQSASAAEARHASEDVDYWADRIANAADKTEEAADKIETSTKTAADNSVSALKNADTSGAGLQFVKGFANSIDDNAYLGASAAGRLGSIASKALNNKLLVKSPSRVTAETGKYFVEGFENSILGGLSSVEYLGERLGMAASKGLAFGSYMPESYGNTYSTKTISAPISVNVTVNGSVDDPEDLTNQIADRLVNLINSERGVFA